jgi:hypothetical protein
MDNKKKKILQKALLEELEEQKGIVSTACNNTQTPRSTFYLWLKEDEEFKLAVEEIQEVAIDYVESKLFEKIEGVSEGKRDANGKISVYKVPPSDTAIIFYLKTKAKKRGYVEKSQMEITKGNDVSLDLS